MVDEAMVRRADRLLALPAAPEPPAAVPRRAASPRRTSTSCRRGATFSAPGVTLTEGHAALHQAIVGDRLRLALDADAVRRRCRARRACWRIRCWCATSRSGSRPLRACACWATSSIAGSAHDRCRSARRCARPPRSSRRRAASRGARHRRAARAYARRPGRAGARLPPRAAAAGLGARGHRTTADDDLAASATEVDRCRGTGPRRAGISTPLRAEPLGSLFAERARGRRGRRRGGRDRDCRARARAPVAQHGARRTPTPARARTAGGSSTAGTSSASPRACHARAAGPRDDPGVGVVRPPRPDVRGRRLHSRVEITTCEPLADGGLVHLRVHDDRHGR